MPPCQACRRRGVFEGVCLWLATVPISCLHSLILVISYFTAPQLPPMNWWLLIPCLHPSSLYLSPSLSLPLSLSLSLGSRPFCATAYWMFPPGCLTGTSNSTSETAPSSSQAKPAFTYASSQQMTPLSTCYPVSSMGPFQSWLPLAVSGPHTADMYW